VNPDALMCRGGAMRRPFRDLYIEGQRLAPPLHIASSGTQASPRLCV